MYFTNPSEHTPRNVREQLAKTVMLLGISLGLLAFLNIFMPATMFAWQSTGWILRMSYANDLVLPFALYFFLCLGERWLRTWRGRAFLAWAVFVLLELGQGLYYRVASGRYVGTFDLIDILMYTTSVGLAVVTEQKVFPRLFKFWR